MAKQPTDGVGTKARVLGGLRVEKVVVQNYRCIRAASVRLNPGLNIIVGGNEAGKSTFLEAVHLALTCQINGRSLRQQLHPHLFNHEVAEAFCTKANAGEKCYPPAISIEVFLAECDEFVRLRGTNNSEHRDVPGLRLVVRLDDEFGDDFAAFIARRDVAAVPVEFYIVEWLTFANEQVHPRRVPLKSRLIDATTVVAERGSSRYLLDVVDDHLDPSQKIDMCLAYRLLKDEFQKNESVAALNGALAKRTGEITDKTLTVSLDTTAADTWQSAVVPLLDRVPFSLIGKGEQASVKLRLALDAASTVGVLLVEEPENHQSHARLNGLLEGFRAHGQGKQFVVTTHSSFVVNKLGLADVLLFRRGQDLRLTDLDDDTQRYFRKLPGHDTLRLILAERAILVEGPSDELVVQRAFLDRHGKLPLAAGVEVIAVGALAFRRFMAIAELLGTPVVVVTDNDGDPAGARERWVTSAENIKVCIGDDSGPSLEQQIVAVNDLAVLNVVLGRTDASKEAALKWMTAKGNKAEAALRIFDSKTRIRYPSYIDDAISI